MALGMYFRPGAMTPERYEEVIRRLAEAGWGAPPGREYHAALETNGLIEVFDVWTSQELFDAFGEVLIPILTDIGAEPAPPEVTSVHNVIVG